MKTFLALLSLFPLVLSAQFATPAASPAAVSSAEVGYTQLTIDYHRPSVRERIIFGDLIPFGGVWRAGANENTLLKIDKEVMIGDSLLYPGTYSVYLVPNDKKEWIWIINRDIKNWGTRGYDPRNDVVRVPVKARRLAERVQTLEYRWMNVRPQSVELTLEWEWYRVPLPISLPTNQQVADLAAIALNPAREPDFYYEAARYYLENNLNLKQAKAWMDRWAAQTDEERYDPIRSQALIEYKLGNMAKGKRLMERSLDLAREQKNGHYVRMNEKDLRMWLREAAEISSDSLLARSIRYHDPEGVWGSKVHLLQVAESRPGGRTRRTRLSLYPATNDFDIQQVRGQDKIQLRYMGGSFTCSHQGRTEIADSVRQRLRLTEERTKTLRDYYTYLYGLPMKLRDPGTVLQPTVHKTWYDDRELLELEVHYAPKAGNDIWFFYFDPTTYALSGYAFYHEKDGPGTGEYILLEEEAKVGKLVLPSIRHWYGTENKLYLGTDEILK